MSQLEQIAGAKKEIGFGSQIRSYVLQPYQMIKDHRTKYQEGQVDKVLNGDIDPFIKDYLMKKASGTLGQPAPWRAGLVRPEGTRKRSRPKIRYALGTG